MKTKNIIITIFILVIVSLGLFFLINYMNNNKDDEYNNEINETIPPDFPPPRGEWAGEGEGANDTLPIPIIIKNESNPFDKFDQEILSYGISRGFYRDIHVENNYCEPFRISTKPGKKVEIVFIGVDYSSISQMKFDLNRYLFSDSRSMFTKEPFKSRIDDFNIWIYPEIMPKENYTLYIGNARGLLSNSLVKGADANCTHNYIFAFTSNSLSNRGQVVAIGGYFGMGSGSSIAHEVGGHMVGYLADEYSPNTPVFYTNYPLNCDKYSTCSKFSMFPSVEGCFKGCSQTDNYRTSELSIMKSIYANGFGKVNEYIINKRIDKLIGTNIILDCRNLGCFSNQSCMLIGNSYSCKQLTCDIIGCPAEQSCDLSNNEYKCNIILPSYFDKCIQTLYGRYKNQASTIPIGSPQWLGNLGREECVIGSSSYYSGGCLSYPIPNLNTSLCLELNTALGCGKVTPEDYKRTIQSRNLKCIY